VVAIAADPSLWRETGGALDWARQAGRRVAQHAAAHDPRGARVLRRGPADRLTHDGDPRLAEHIANAVLRDDRHGPRIVKESKSSPRKIDLAVCAVGALDMAKRLASAKEARRRSYYEDHDLVVF
jgi:phage terminase large subunit-like protein